ncbi:MAG: hypothetical protein ACE5J6_02090 [Candidatus Bathyarchaeia archaeon]
MGALTTIIELFPLAGIWFGAWGVLAVYIGNMIAVLPVNPLHIAPLLALSAIAQSAIPAWAFKFFKADPRLKIARDVVVFVLFGVFLNSLAGTLIGPTVWYIFGAVSWRMLITVSMPSWFIRGLIINTIISIPLLKLLSGTVIEARAYCEGWFS